MQVTYSVNNSARRLGWDICTLKMQVTYSFYW